MPTLTAELHFDHQVQRVEADEGQLVSVGRRSDRDNVRPSIDLTGAPDGKTVSRRHGDLYVRDGRWYLRVEDTARNATLLDGQTVPDGADVPLRDGSKLTLGRVEMVFVTPAPIGVAADRIAMSTDQPKLTVAAGDVQQTVVTIVNHTGVVAWFEVEIDGIDPDWYQIQLDLNRDPDDASRARLYSVPMHSSPTPDAMTHARILFKPPRASTTRAGTYPVRLSATMAAAPHLRRTFELTLVVLPYADMTFQLDEERAHGRQGSFPFTVQNLGNADTQVRLRLEGDGLQLTTDASGYQPGQNLAPGAEARGQILAQAAYWHWWGVDRGYPFQVHASSVADPGTERLGTAQLVCPPRLPPWLQGILHALQGMLAQVITLALILGVAYLILRPPVINDFTADSPIVVQGASTNLNWQVDGANTVTFDPALPTPAPTPAPTPPAAPADHSLTAGVIQPVVDKVRNTWAAFVAVVSPAPIRGSASVNPTETTIYTLTAKRALPVFPSTRTVSVRIVPPAAPPKIDALVASPDRIGHEGQPIQLNWQLSGSPPTKLELIASAPNRGVVDEQIQTDHFIASQSVSPSFNHETYQLEVFGPDPDKPTDTATVSIGIDPPVISSFTADPVTAGSPVTVRWQVTGETNLQILSEPDPAQSIDVNALLQQVAGGGIQATSVPPGYPQWTSPEPIDVSTLILLIAQNQGGQTAKAVRVSVPPAIANFQASPSSITKGSSTTLSWTVNGVAPLTVTLEAASPAIPGAAGAAAAPTGAPAPSFTVNQTPATTTFTVVPDQTTTYSLSVKDANGMVADPKAVTVTVTSPGAKVDFFLATPSTIPLGQKTTLSYSVQGARQITIKSDDGKVNVRQPTDLSPAQGSLPVSPTVTTTYVLTASGVDPTNVIVVPLTVTVQPPTPTPAPSPTTAATPGSAPPGPTKPAGAAAPTPTPRPKR